MVLTPGTRIGPYEIVSAIGAGGMGEVYQARDTKLNRTVALKILPAAFANDPDRLARFRREAQVLASLNHPNIAAIYGLEDSGDTHALVMELVPGRTLAQLIGAPTRTSEVESVSSRPRESDARPARESLQPDATGVGPRRPERSRAPRGLSIDDALPIARQIASALEAAHEQGVVHRDLKPANVKITDDGTVKVLDFGLAKALAPAGVGSAPNLADSPTLTSPAMTELGMILGTAGYMAPEQAKGKAVDRRADIWALGVVLFEMLAGKSLYRGETVTETIAHVITQAPDWTLLPATTPAAVRRLLRRCLEKDPKNRMQSAGDVRIEIDEILVGTTEGEAASSGARPAAPQTPVWRRALPWVISAALLVALGVALRPRPEAPAHPLRMDIQVAGQNEFLAIDVDQDGPIAVLSPNGQALAYLAVTGNVRRLYLRQLDRLQSTPIPGTEESVQPFFSPDGTSVAFFLNGRMMRTLVSGGAPTLITSAGVPRGGAWGPDDTIVYTADMSAGLSRVPAGGGTAVALTKLGANERTHRWPSFLPDGKAVLFICQLANGSYDDGTIEAVRLDTGERKVLIRGGTFPQYVASGHLTYVRQNTVYAVPFDPVRLEVHGDPKPILSGVLATGAGVGAGQGNGSAQFSVAPNGIAMYLPATGELDTLLRLAILDAAGKSVYEYPESKLFRDPKFSPDGKRVAVRVGDGKVEQIHVLDTSRGTLTKLTFDGTLSGYPVWSRDGQRLAFASDRSGKGGIDVYMANSDGSGEVKALTARNGASVPTSFSADGRFLAVSTSDLKTGMDLATIALAEGTLTPFVNTPAVELLGGFSPDGRWVVYQMSESNGPPHIFVRRFPDGGSLRQVSDGVGFMPLWTKGGREIVYLSGSRDSNMASIVAVDVTVEGQALVLGKPRKLFDAPVSTPNNSISFDVNADGTRFAMLLIPAADKPSAAPRRTNGVLLVNFFEELRRVIGK